MTTRGTDAALRSTKPVRPLRVRLAVSIPLLGAFAVGAIAYGGLYCYPPISVAFAAEFHVSRTVAVTPWTVFLLVSGLSSPLLGHAYDVFLDRQLLTGGMLLLALGWALAAVAPDVGILVLAYGVLLALGLQLVFVGTTTAIARRYAGRAGLALGIAYAGPGIGVAVALPIVASVIAEAGWRSVAVGFVVASVAGIPFVWLMTSGPPILVPVRERRPVARHHGEARPYEGVRLELQAVPARGLHEASGPGVIAASHEEIPAEGQQRATSLRRTLRTRRFWLLFLGALALGTVDEGVFQVFIPHAASRGIPESVAAQGLGLESLAYVFGQVAGGALSDRSGRRFVGVVMALLTLAGATAAFAGDGGTAGLAIAGIAVHGFGIGASIAIRSATFSDVFGGHGFGATFGILAIAYPVGGILAMYVGAVALDLTGNEWPVYGLAVLAIGAWALALLAAGPRKRGLAARLERLRARVPG